ncbi:MAG TPA: Crp/Fnr family transcriptional regulator, partial [Ignavibacteriaceae bacterium]|nr:Crp/Fnr family transcriptional regulator [Ignavibacteriaceae bacterium]
KYVPIFSELSDTILTKVEEAGIIRNFKKDTVILNEFYEGTGLYIIIEGDVKVTENDIDGREIILQLLTQHDYFGEMSLIDGKRPSANVVAMEDCVMFFLSREEFMKLMKTYPEITVALLEELTRRLRFAGIRIKSLSVLNSEGKIASAILQIAENSGRIKQGSVEVVLPYQHDIASMAGTSRETVSRAIHSLEKKGLIEFDGSKVRIPDYNSFKKAYS